jgi:ATP-dependent Clp protease ATP-binding subunit ClpA
MKYTRVTQRAENALLAAEAIAAAFPTDYNELCVTAAMLQGDFGIGTVVVRMNGVKLDDVHDFLKCHLRGAALVNLNQWDLWLDESDFLKAASDEAQGLDHRYVGCEHLLLSALRDARTGMMTFLAELGIEPRKMRGDVFDILGEQIPAAGCVAPRASWTAAREMDN